LTLHVQQLQPSTRLKLKQQQLLLQLAASGVRQLQQQPWQQQGSRAGVPAAQQLRCQQLLQLL
jgi:hypothetical protein